MIGFFLHFNAIVLMKSKLACVLSGAFLNAWDCTIERMNCDATDVALFLIDELEGH